MIKELKPLIANLQMLQYGYYLQSNSYESILLENDLDDYWAAAIQIANKGNDVIYIGDTVLHESAFKICVEKFWKDDKELFNKFIGTTIEGLISENMNKDYSKLSKVLDNLGISFMELSKSYEDNKNSISENSNQIEKSIKKNKIFISHSSSNKDYGEKLVELLRKIGVKENEIIFTSNTAYGIPVGQNIFNWLKSQINEKPLIIYLLSEDYYKSIACLNEMGAAWIVENKHVAIFTPNFNLSSKEFQNGALDPREIGFFIDDKERILSFIQMLSIDFEITKNHIIIYQSVDKFIHEVEQLPKSMPVIQRSDKIKKESIGKTNITPLQHKLKPKMEPSNASHIKGVGLYEKFKNLIISKKMKDDELILLHYIIETGRFKLMTGWQEHLEIANIKEWEKINDINDILSKHYPSVLKRYELRGYTEVSAVTSSNNPKEIKIKGEISKNLLDLPQEITEAIEEVVKRNYFEHIEEPNNEDYGLPF